MVSPSQRYLSTRGGSYGCKFEDVVLEGLASDGGLFICEEIPAIPDAWNSEGKDTTNWLKWDFQRLAFEIFSLYIDSEEIPSDDLREIVRKSYATFRAPEVVPLVCLDEEKGLWLLELFHGPTFAFKVCTRVYDVESFVSLYGVSQYFQSYRQRLIVRPLVSLSFSKKKAFMDQRHFFRQSFSIILLFNTSPMYNCYRVATENLPNRT